jgi:hypothetical protein
MFLFLFYRIQILNVEILYNTESTYNIYILDMHATTELHVQDNLI